MPKKAPVTEENETREFAVVAGLIHARDIANKLFNVATPSVVFTIYDFIIGDDGEIEEGDLDDLAKAKEVAEKEVFPGQTLTPDDVLNVYARMFLDDNEDDE